VSSARAKPRGRNLRESVRKKSASYTTKELSKKTWVDFAKLFSQGNGFDHCWCMHFQRAHALPNEQKLTRAERSVINRRQKKQLVDEERAHGILVYAEGEPVGWCQYGPREELPRIDHSRKYTVTAKDVASTDLRQKLWRITCFAVLRKRRKGGVAGAALKAALHAIQKKGGGVVEAYPIARWQSHAFGNESTHGAASMFERAGFERVATFGKTRFSTHVLMRKTVPEVQFPRRRGAAH
jgi:GNAT superfamily N-acetyltransferase